MNIKSTLVTGGAGFIGSYVVDKLINKNIETKVLVSGFRSSNHPSIINKKAIIINGNLLDYNSLLKATKDVDVVFHIGGIVSHYCVKYPELTIDTNIKGTWNLKEACVVNNVKRIIYASSSFVYGDPTRTDLGYNHNERINQINEHCPTNPKDLLGVTKLASEKILQSTHPHKIDYTILRLFNVYGGRQYPDNYYTSALSTWIRKAINNESLEIHDTGEQSLDFTYVEDFAEAFILSINNLAKNEIFNVASGKSISMNELAKLVNKLTNNKAPPHYNKNHPMFLKSIQADIKKINLILGWKPRTEIEEGLTKTINEVKLNINKEKIKT